MTKTIIKTVSLTLFVLLCSCSLFPDKEKQYLQHSELAALQLPPDLQSRLETGLSSAEQTEPDPQERNPGEDENASENTTEIDDDRIPLLVDIGKEPIHIEIFDNFEQSWRQVGKTLTHMGLEVLDRDEDNGQYFIVYEKDTKPADDSLWSFLAFWQDDGQHEEFDFRVKLLENDASTRVFILDADEQPVTEGPGRTLIHKIYQAL